MPKYYCDYCDIFLTHDSPSVRKSHNEGWKHKAAVRAYYSQFEEEYATRMMTGVGIMPPPPLVAGRGGLMPPPIVPPPPIHGMPMGGPPMRPPMMGQPPPMRM